MNARTCRFCSAPLHVTFCDLGLSPLSNAFVEQDEARRGELFYPLHAFVCERCFLVQLEQFETPESIFGEYVYFSSYSDSWLEHCRRFAARMTGELHLGHDSLVVEVASNDGYLLQFFREAGVPVLGIEPARNVARVAQDRGIETLTAFFGTTVAQALEHEGRHADLLIANNVIAHVPDLNDFVSGVRRILRPRGVFTIEFPHLLRLVLENQFDTIYHEHFSYFSLGTVREVLAQHGLAVHDVEELPTHGGSLRVHASLPSADRAVSRRVDALLETERRAGLRSLPVYESFAAGVRRTKRDLLRFLIDAAESGKRVVGYGAAAKGNTLLNYCGVRGDLIDFVVDRSPHKQGRLLPGTRIPVHSPERIFETRPDYVLILAWNLKDEIMQQMSRIAQWNARFVVPIPQPRVLA